ncbi:MAG TPA: hypothetical protein VEF53_05410 [Patescibacteria group bacterium]|jgi:hypothetical protein|nr:hypothetical protein [Patescibacteria group bacterium]
MNKQTKVTSKKQVVAHMDLDDMGIEEIMESDLEDYEIAAELGMSLSQVSRIRRELFED